MPKQVPQTMEKQALELYMQYVPIQRISQLTRMPYSTVRDRVHKGTKGQKPWLKVREEVEKQYITEIVSNKVPLMRDIMNMSLLTLKTSLSALIDTREQLDLGDLKRLSEIVSNIDKIIRLDEGLSTDNIAVAGISPLRTAADIRSTALNAMEVLGLGSAESEGAPE